MDKIRFVDVPTDKLERLTRQRRRNRWASTGILEKIDSTPSGKSFHIDGIDLKTTDPKEVRKVFYALSASLRKFLREQGVDDQVVLMISQYGLTITKK